MEATKIAKSLYDIFTQIPKDAQKEFIRILQREKRLSDWRDEDWQSLGLESFADEWNRPENDIWDEHFQNHNSMK